MADKTTIIEIQYDTAQAEKNLVSLSNDITKLEQDQAALKKAFKEGQLTQEQYSQALAENRAELSKGKKEQKETINLLKAEKGSVDAVKAEIARLTTERNKLNKNTLDGSKKFGEYNDKIKELRQSLKDAEKETGKTRGAFAKFGNDLQNLPGPIGGVIRGIVAMTKAGLAFIATPIGAVIAAIGVAVLAVKAAFKSSEEGQNKYAKIMTVIGAIMGNLNDLLADFGEKIIGAFENPKQALKDFGKMLKENIVNRLEGLVELIPNLGKAIGLLFKGQFKEAGKVAVDSLMKVTSGVENFTDKVQAAIDKTKEMIAENVREANQAAKVADMRAKADKLERNLIIKRAELESQIAELRLKGREEDQYTAEQRKEFLEEARQLQDNLLSEEKKVLILRRDAQKLENTFSRTTKENKMKEAQAIADVSRKEAERFNQARQIQRELLRIDRQLESERKKIDSEREKAEKNALKRREDAIKKLNSLDEQRLLKQAETLEEEYNLLVEAENAKFELLLENDQLLNEERELIEAEHLERLDQLRESYKEKDLARLKEITDSYNDSFSTILNSAGIFADQRLALQGSLTNGIMKLNTLEKKDYKAKYDLFSQFASDFTSFIFQSNQAQLDDLAKQKAAELSVIGLTDKQKQDIEKKYAAKEAELKRRQFNQDKTKAIADSLIQGAIAVTKTLATSGLPAAIPFIATLGVLTAAQTAIIARQKPPQFTSDQVFAEGGSLMIGGKSHSQGGTKFFGTDGTKFEAEKGEGLFILKKDATAEIAALSKINQSFGGRPMTSMGRYMQEGGQIDQAISANINPDVIKQAIIEGFENVTIITRVEDIQTGLTEFDKVVSNRIV